VWQAGELTCVCGKCESWFISVWQVGDDLVHVTGGRDDLVNVFGRWAGER
jgi:hypothetical protein